jgi:hypothetical protein
MNQQVTNYIDNAPADQKEIMNTIRTLIHQSVQNAEEEFKWSRPVFRTKKDFAYLKTAKNHVTLGFFNPEKINDPQNLLEGTGKDMKHINIRHINDINTGLFASWLKSVSEN